VFPDLCVFPHAIFQFYNQRCDLLKQEAEFFASKAAESLGRDPSVLRLEIEDPEYWHQETIHYNDLRDALPTRDHDVFHPANSLPTEEHNHTVNPLEALMQAPQDNYSTGFVEALSPHNSVQAPSKYHTTDLLEAQFIPTHDRDACSARSSTQGPRRSNRLKELAARNCRILKQGQSTYHTIGLFTEKRPRRSTRLKICRELKVCFLQSSMQRVQLNGKKLSVIHP